MNIRGSQDISADQSTAAMLGGTFLGVSKEVGKDLLQLIELRILLLALILY